MTSLQDQIRAIVKAVPYGRVVSYGQVADYTLVPCDGRIVGWQLRSMDCTGVPWHRVVNTVGRISIKGNSDHDKLDQRALLQAEGIEIGDDFTFDIELYRWRPTNIELETLVLSTDQIPALLKKYRTKEEMTLW